MKVKINLNYPNLFQIFQCKGFENMYNDILVQIPQKTKGLKNTIFFCGDLQDYEDKMFKNQFEFHFINESFEKTCLKLCEKFENENIFFIVPSKREENLSMNEFYNFYHGGKSLIHLKELYFNSISMLNEGKKNLKLNLKSFLLEFRMN
jgi:hypothetical protein